MDAPVVPSGRVDQQDWRYEIARHGWTAEVSLHGDLDRVDPAVLRQVWSQAIDGQPTKVLVVDMTEVTFIEGAVAQWLVECHHQARAVDAQLVVLAPSGEPRELLRILDVAHVVTLLDAWG
ncbi:MAG TPA: STAS domain-containing protein [Solirubrobacteraceae bacterium]